MRTLLLMSLGVAALCGAEKFGAGLTLKEATPVETLLGTPADYVGKMVQVKGKITEVCQMMGCWLQVQDGDKAVRIKVNHVSERRRGPQSRCRRHFQKDRTQPTAGRRLGEA